MLSKVNLYDACAPIIENGLLGWNTVDFVNIGGNTPFRELNWEDHKSEMDFLVNNNLVRACATYRDDQLVFLKDYLGNKCFSIGFTYQESSYEFMLDVFVKTHLHRQACGLVEITEHDQQLRSGGVNLVQHYTSEFDRMGLIPKKVNSVVDYKVPIEDFLDQNIFFNHIKNLGVTPTDNAVGFYQEWLKNFDMIQSL